MDILEFKLTGVPQETEEGTKYLAAKMVVFINGVPLLRVGQDYAVDTSSLLAQVCAPGEVFLYTCSCGNAGCAGIDRGVRLEPTDELLQWNLPEDVFGQWLSSEHGQRRQFEFALAHYQAALGSICSQLQAMSNTAGLPVDFCIEPYPCEERLSTPLALLFEKDRAHRAQWEAVAARRERVYGALRNAEVRIVLTKAVTLATNLEWLTEHLAQEACLSDEASDTLEEGAQSDENVESEDTDEAALTTLVASFRASPEQLTRAIRAFSLETLLELCWFSRGSRDDVAELSPADKDNLASRIAFVTVSLHPV